jgi:hypothetical protein
MGQIGSAMGNPNTFAPQPSGFSGSEWAARFMGAGAKGLGQGFQNMQQQQQAMRPNAGPQQPGPMQGAPNTIQAPDAKNFTAADGPGTGVPDRPAAFRNKPFWGMQ